VWITVRGENIVKGVKLNPVRHTHLPGDMAERPSPWWPRSFSVTPHHRLIHHDAGSRSE
jgi:hypothetical protein